MIPERRLEAQAQAPVRKAVPKTRSNMGRFVARLVVTVGIGLFAVSRFAVAAQAGYQLDYLHSQLTVATSQEANLEGQVAALTSTERLVSEAPKLQLAPASTVMAVSVPAVQTQQTASATQPKVKRSGFLAAIGAVIQAIANEVARL